MMYSKYKARKMGLSQIAKFYRKDIFKENLEGYKTAVIFGAETMVIYIYIYIYIYICTYNFF